MNKFLMFTVALGIVFLSSCSNEEKLSTYAPKEGDGKLTFILPMAKKTSVTYAYPGDTIDAEYQVNNMFIYWVTYDGSKSQWTVFKTFAYGAGAGASASINPIDLRDDANTTTATIGIGGETAASRFYFIANVNGPTNVHAALLNNVQVGLPEDSLQNVISDALVMNGQSMELLGTPLPMSINKSTNSGKMYVDVPDLTVGVISNVHLKRRVARFDIINTAAFSNFEISNVYISRAQKRGWLQDTAFIGTESWATQVGGIQIPGSGANGPAGIGDSDGDGKDDLFDDPVHKNDTAWVNPAVFYLWPTVLKKNDVSDPTDGTEILLEGKFMDGNTRMYKLYLDDDQAIEANKIYRISVTRATINTLKFELIIDPWLDGPEPDSTVQTSTLINWAANSSISASNGWTIGLDTITQAPTFEYSASDSIPVTLTITTSGTNKGSDSHAHVTSVNIYSGNNTTYGHVSNDLTRTTSTTIIQSNTTVTYGAQYTTVHTIQLPPTDAPLWTELQITNPNNDQDYKIIKLYSNNYGKTGYKPIRVGNLLWAPVNVGATDLPPEKPTPTTSNKDTYFKYTGYYFEWGRNIPYGGMGYPTLTTTSTQFTSLSSAYTDSAYYNGSNINWLSTLGNYFWDRDSAQGPCPAGWRVPSREEIEALILASNVDANNFWLRYKIAGTTDTIFIPSNGAYKSANIGNLTTGDSSNKPYVLLWSATMDTVGVGTGTKGYPYRWYHNNAAPTCEIKPSTYDHAKYAYGIRAVRDIPTP
ncbi:MAG: hypothetical protein LBH04_00635 [Tannerellaceae bacterium]|nr:hypothetical protein [Tannerellaceae bacterium]